MRKLTVITFLGIFITVAVLVQSCKKDDPVPSEFIATDATFANFDALHLHTTKQGVDPANGGLHDNNDATVTRKVFIKDDASLVDGQYPVGTVLVKHSYNPDLAFNQITAMVKRGNNFDAGFGNWEYFMLQPDGKIAKDAGGNLMRGAKLFNGMCQNCHVGASAKDFVFSK